MITIETVCVVLPPSSSVVVMLKFVVPAARREILLTVIAPVVALNDVPAGNDPLAITALTILPSASDTEARTSAFAYASKFLEGAIV